MKKIIVLDLFLTLLGTVWLSAQVVLAKPATTKSAAESYVLTRDYVHQWMRLPELKGLNLKGQETTLTPEYGWVEVLVFLSSACIPCQHLIAPMHELEKTYAKRHTRFTYIFTHDTLQDAKEFARVHQLDQAMIAGQQILQTYHDPLVPCIYVGDRYGWLLTRFTQTDRQKVKELKELLEHITTF